MDSLRTLLVLLPVAALVAAGCNNPNAVPAHSAADDKAMAAYNSMTPQQHIDAIEKGPMPAAAKQAMIQKIKEQNHLP
jgi:hypothetical protein